MGGRRENLSAGRGLVALVALGVALASPAHALGAASPRQTAESSSDGAATLDPTFGTAGSVLTPLPEGLGFRTGWKNSTTLAAPAAAGEFVVATEHMLIRYRRDGSIDRRFGRNGRIGLPGVDVVAIAVDQANRVVVLAEEETHALAARILRYTARGKPDSSFGGGGEVITDFGLPPPRDGNVVPMPSSVPEGEATALAIDQAGRILVGGDMLYSYEGFGPGIACSFVARMREDGTPDPTFGDEGRFYCPMPYEPKSVSQLVVQGSSILVVGAVEKSPYTRIARFDEDGAPDQTFANLGVVEIASWERPEEVLVDEAERIVFLTARRVWRLQSDGTPDPEFGREGEAAIPLPGKGSRLNDMALAPGGRILVTGEIVHHTDGQHPKTRTRLVVRALSADGSLEMRVGRRGFARAAFGRRSNTVGSAVLSRHGGRAIALGPAQTKRSPSGFGIGIFEFRLR